MKEASVKQEAITNILELVRAGVPLKTAARAHGVGATALARLERNPATSSRIETARAQAHIALLEQLEDLISEGRPTAAVLWKLERLYPKDWGPPPKQIEVDQSEGNTLISLVHKFSK